MKVTIPNKISENSKDDTMDSDSHRIIDEGISSCKPMRKKSKLEKPQVDVNLLAVPGKQAGDGSRESVGGGKKRPLYKDLVIEDSLSENLPKIFTIKYLGKTPTRGLWGIKNTRQPVDDMIEAARTLGVPMPVLKLLISEEGVKIWAAPQNKNPSFEGGFFPIQWVSYGVQDLIYTRVFAMIVIEGTSANPAPEEENSPFQCYGFVCDNPETVQGVTKALAAAFRKFSEAEDARESAAGSKSGQIFRKLSQFDGNGIPNICFEASDA